MREAELYKLLINNLKNLHNSGISDQEIADDIGCTHQQVNNLRNGKRSFANMRLETVLKLFPSLLPILLKLAKGQSITNTNAPTITAGRDANNNHITTAPAPSGDLIERLINFIISSDFDDDTKNKIIIFLVNYQNPNP